MAAAAGAAAAREIAGHGMPDPQSPPAEDLREKSGRRRRRGHTPYLDKLSVNAHTPESGDEFWRRLLIQPISLPDLSHTGIRTAFDSVEESSLLGPDGKTTRRLKSLIKDRVEVSERAAAAAMAIEIPREVLEAHQASTGPLSPQQAQHLEQREWGADLTSFAAAPTPHGWQQTRQLAPHDQPPQAERARPMTSAQSGQRRKKERSALHPASRGATSPAATGRPMQKPPLHNGVMDPSALLTTRPPARSAKLDAVPTKVDITSDAADLVLTQQDLASRSAPRADSIEDAKAVATESKTAAKKKGAKKKVKKKAKKKAKKPVVSDSLTGAGKTTGLSHSNFKMFESLLDRNFGRR